MEKLIQKLNLDHYQVFATLDKVKHLGVNSRDGQRFLLEAKQKLQKHLKYEISVVNPLASKKESAELKKLLRYHKSEIERFLKQSSKFSQRSFLFSIQGKDSNENFAKLLGKFKNNLLMEQKLISKELNHLGSEESF